MKGISLTTAMRHNLLSLQNISGQVSVTQKKLATGKKVTSAIDNPSNYYTAVSLENRAKDLNELLNGISQGIQTVKAATAALQSGSALLQQAATVAAQSLENTYRRQIRMFRSALTRRRLKSRRRLRMKRNLLPPSTIQRQPTG